MINKSKKNIFTLLELLVVIAIIAISFPVIHGIRKRAKITLAKAQMQAIITAVSSYDSTYGILPLVNANWNNNSGGNNSQYNRLMQLLTDLKKNGNVPTLYRNGRQIKFLDVPTNYIGNGYIDPWGRRYYLYIDKDYDRVVSPPPEVNSNSLYGTVFVLSLGGGNSTSDDSCVYSWK